jgi:hypothetical protein
MDTTNQAHNKVQDPPTVAPASTAHQYNLVSSRTDNALVEVISRAPSIQDHPQLYIGEELRGHILWSPGSLAGIETIDVVVSWHPGCQNID